MRCQAILFKSEGRTSKEVGSITSCSLKNSMNCLCGTIDFYYGDESHVCSQGYGWQFPDEEVCILSEKAYKVNCMAFINRQNQCRWKMTEKNIDTEFILEYLEQFSFQIQKTTFIVLDNAQIHKAKTIMERIPYWQKRGLYIFFLSPY